MSQTEKEEIEKNEPLEETISQSKQSEGSPMEESSALIETDELTQNTDLPAENLDAAETSEVGESIDMPSVSESEESQTKDPQESKESVESGSEEAEASSDKKQKDRKVQHQHAQEEFDKLIKSIESENNIDEKLRIAVENMEVYLSQGGTPLFKYFWELRKMSLEFFKENVSPMVRANLWPKYSHLSKEARRLKEIFDEQSAFAVEQIDIAISALESEIENFEDSVASQPDVEFQGSSKFLDRKKAVYNDIQKRLNLLNTHAARINNLRKELMKTDMRIKHKNKFFKRLSLAGDRVFPLRKDLIKKISDQFLSDVEYFLAQNFSVDQIKGSVFYLREEIKVLQGIAKILTLNTHSFTSTRLRLSECWDKLKAADKERKKEYAEKKDVFVKNKAEIEEQITALRNSFESGELSTGAASKQIDEVQVKMRKVELGRDEVKSLKHSLSQVHELIKAKKKAEEEARIQEEREKLRIKKEKLDALKKEIQDVHDNADNIAVEEVQAKQKEFEERILQLKELSGREKLDLERSMRYFKDLLNRKQEEALLNLSDDDQHALQNLRDVLKQRRSRRKEIKEHYDVLRKASGSSGLDFEQAMMHNDQVNAEKERLDQADQGISEIEKKIKEIKNKI